MGKEPNKKYRPALSPDAREKQIIALAYDEAERLIRNGQASSQLITHFVKRGSTKEKLEQEIMEANRELALAKTQNIKDANRLETLIDDALKAMKTYSGRDDDEEYDDE